MKNKFLNKIAETTDFKGFHLFQLSRIRKINETVKDRKFAFAQQVVAQLNKKSQQAVDRLIINTTGV